MSDLANISQRRRTIFGAVLSLLLVSSCEAKPMRVFLNISLFSYLDRPIFDVKMNGTDFGGGLAHAFYGENDVMLMQPITLGPQIVTWRLDGPEGMARNGEVVTAKNWPVLSKVPVGVRSLALHIYPDETIEIKLGNGTSDELRTQRGQKIIEDWEAKKNGH